MCFVQLLSHNIWCFYIFSTGAEEECYAYAGCIGVFFFFFNLNRTIILCYMMAEERSGVSVLIM